MGAKRPSGYFTLKDTDYSSPEMIFNALSILESRGYHGWMELMSVVNDPNLIIKILRLFYGMEIKVPPLKEFNDCLGAALYSFCDYHKSLNSVKAVDPKDIRQFMKIDIEEEAKLIEIINDWLLYMHKEGHDVRKYIHINRSGSYKKIDAMLKERTGITRRVAGGKLITRDRSKYNRKKTGNK